MGKDKQRRKAFFEANPLCIFCGGLSQATTIDHIPSRSFFDDRKWPEGYEFPSCAKCNKLTSHDELVVAAVARLYPDAITQEQKLELRDLFQAVRNNLPEVMKELEPDANQVRHFQSLKGVPSDAAKTPINVSGPRTIACIETFCRKLLFSLHYRHTKRIIPSHGAISFKWYTNIQKYDGSFNTEIFSLTSQMPTIKRQRRLLNDQFEYTFGIGENDCGAYFITLRDVFAIEGCVFLNSSVIDDAPNIPLFRPFVHTT